MEDQLDTRVDVRPIPTPLDPLVVAIVAALRGIERASQSAEKPSGDEALAVAA